MRLISIIMTKGWGEGEPEILQLAWTEGWGEPRNEAYMPKGWWEPGN